MSYGEGDMFGHLKNRDVNTEAYKGNTIVKRVIFPEAGREGNV